MIFCTNEIIFYELWLLFRMMLECGPPSGNVCPASVAAAVEAVVPWGVELEDVDWCY